MPSTQFVKHISYFLIVQAYDILFLPQIKAPFFRDVIMIDIFQLVSDINWANDQKTAHFPSQLFSETSQPELMVY